MYELCSAFGQPPGGLCHVGHDGRRGYLYHLAVVPDFRQRGIASGLVIACLAKLRLNGIPDPRDRAYELPFTETRLRGGGGRAFRAAVWNSRWLYRGGDVRTPDLAGSSGTSNALGSLFLRTLAVLANVLGVFDMARIGAYCFYCLLTTVLSPVLLWMALLA